LEVNESHRIKKLPIGDGGEGTVSALVSASNGEDVTKGEHFILTTHETDIVEEGKLEMFVSSI